MGWEIGYDSNWKRDIGYGVPAICDHPNCNEEIDRGLAYVCGGDVMGGEHGCGLFFCSKHMWMSKRLPQQCECCTNGKDPFEAEPDTVEWVNWKLTDDSWRQWRDENPKEVKRMREEIK